MKLDALWEAGAAWANEITPRYGDLDVVADLVVSGACQTANGGPTEHLDIDTSLAVVVCTALTERGVVATKEEIHCLCAALVCPQLRKRLFLSECLDSEEEEDDLPEEDVNASEDESVAMEEDEEVDIEIDDSEMSADSEFEDV